MSRAAFHPTTTRWYKWLIRLVTLAILLTAWSVASSFTPQAVLPSPSRVVAAVQRLVSSGQLVAAWNDSLLAIVIAMSIAAVFGILAGLLTGWFVTIDRLTSPVSTALFLTPRIALLPLIVVWFGFQDAAKVVVILAFSFMEVMYTVRGGVRNVESRYVEVARAFCVPRRRLLARVVLPAIAPFVISGLRLGLIYALVGAVLAGFFLEATGIGGLIYKLGANFRTADLVAALLSVALVGILISISLSWLERRLTPWRDGEVA